MSHVRAHQYHNDLGSLQYLFYRPIFKINVSAQENDSAELYALADQVDEAEADISDISRFNEARSVDAGCHQAAYICLKTGFI